MPRPTSYVFGEKKDLHVFGGASLAALVLGLFPAVQGNGFLNFVIADQLHVYSTFFYTYNSKRQWRRFPYALIFIPLLTFAAFFVCGRAWEATISMSIYAHLSAFHFLRQQTAWFKIAAVKASPDSALRRNVDTIGILSVTWGPFLASLAAREERGWFLPGDLYRLSPDWFYYVLSLSAIGAIIYLLYYARAFFKDGEFDSGKQFLFINSAMVWTAARLLPWEMEALGAHLLLFGHSVPYLYLGLTYIEKRKGLGEKFFLLPGSKTGTALFVIWGSFAFSGVEFFSQDIWTDNAFVSLLITISVTHYVIDTFFWKGRLHPEGRRAFD